MLENEGPRFPGETAPATKTFTLEPRGTRRTVASLAVLMLVFTSAPALAAPAIEQQCDALASHPFDRDRPQGVPGVPLKQINKAAALAACQQAAQENASARMLYQNGRALEANGSTVEALDYYRRSAEMGYAAAQVNVEIAYTRLKDDKAAIGWLEKAAAQGNAVAQQRLGSAYAEGRGVEKSMQHAIELYQKSADQGFAPAQTRLGVAYEEGVGVPQDYARAIDLYEKAAAQDDSPAKTNLGRLYFFGIGVARNFDSAERYWKAAADQGDQVATKALSIFQALKDKPLTDDTLCIRGSVIIHECFDRDYANDKIPAKCYGVFGYLKDLLARIEARSVQRGAKAILKKREIESLAMAGSTAIIRTEGCIDMTTTVPQFVQGAYNAIDAGRSDLFRDLPKPDKQSLRGSD